jgi:hypothetical protein
MAKGKDKLFDGVETVRPYVDRALRDEELRDSLREAFAAAREIYGDLTTGNGVGKAASKVVSDKDVQENLRKAIDELRHAADRLQGKEEAHRARSRMLLLSGIAAGVLFNPVTGPATRKWLLDLIGGEEGEATPES